MEDDWKPIETAPEDCTVPVLVFCPKANRGTPSCEVVVMCRDCTGELSYWTNGGPNAGDDLYFGPGEEPTHWMPLPPPPKD